MTARELRIGNYINPKFPMKVVNIFPDEVNADFEGNEGDVFEFKNEDIEGVPIDEEWLLELGIKDGFLKFNYSEMGLNIERAQSTNYWIIKIGYGNEFRPLVALEYRHQLQNLYFSLTGEELEFK